MVEEPSTLNAVVANKGLGAFSSPVSVSLLDPPRSTYLCDQEPQKSLAKRATLQGVLRKCVSGSQHQGFAPGYADDDDDEHWRWVRMSLRITRRVRTSAFLPSEMMMVLFIL